MGVTMEQLSEKLDRLSELTLISAKNVLDLQEAALFTGFSIGHLYRLTSGRQIPHFKKFRKLFFKKSELEEWLLERKVLTEEEIDKKATTYIVKKK